MTRFYAYLIIGTSNNERHNMDNKQYIEALVKELADCVIELHATTTWETRRDAIERIKLFSYKLTLASETK